LSPSLIRRTIINKYHNPSYIKHDKRTKTRRNNVTTKKQTQMYGYLVKIADELKNLRAESEQLINASEYAQRAWHEGGMWRGPNVLPGAAASSGLDASRRNCPGAMGSLGIGMGGGGGGGGMGGNGTNGGGNNNNNGQGAVCGGPGLVPRAPVSLTDLFLDIVSECIIRFVFTFPRRVVFVHLS
jgi:hypothetical protein